MYSSTDLVSNSYTTQRFAYKGSTGYELLVDDLGYVLFVTKPGEDYYAEYISWEKWNDIVDIADEVSPLPGYVTADYTAHLPK